jgi:hypothetical protein
MATDEGTDATPSELDDAGAQLLAEQTMALTRVMFGLATPSSRAHEAAPTPDPASYSTQPTLHQVPVTARQQAPAAPAAPPAEDAPTALPVPTAIPLDNVTQLRPQAAPPPAASAGVDEPAAAEPAGPAAIPLPEGIPLPAGIPVPPAGAPDGDPHTGADDAGTEHEATTDLAEPGSDEQAPAPPAALPVPEAPRPRRDRRARELLDEVAFLDE